MAIMFPLHSVEAIEKARAEGKTVEVYEGEKSWWAAGSMTKALAHTVEYKGAVLALGERNYYDDSDFYAVVWDEAAGKIREIEYGTTRFAGGGNAIIDATDEVRAKADDYLVRWALEKLIRDDKADARRVAKGKRVRVVKGRKVKIGTEGLVFYMGERSYGYGSRATRIGIALDDDEMERETRERRDGSTYTVSRHKNVVWTYLHNVEVIDPASYETPVEELRKYAERARGRYRLTSVAASARMGLAVVA